MLEENRTPFVRNFYYEGKPLKSNDFMLEQQYMIAKHQLLNSRLNGLSVLEGLNVSQEDELHIRIESGIAFDKEGNEIIVPHKDIKNIKEVKGYHDVQYSYNTYLYIQYKEEKIYGESEIQEQVKESYELYLKEGIPQGYNGQLIESLFNEKGIHIYHNYDKRTSPNKAIKGYLLLDKPIDQQVNITVKANVDGALTTDHKRTYSIEIRGEKGDAFIKVPYMLQVIGVDGDTVDITFEEMKVSTLEEDKIINNIEPFKISIEENPKQETQLNEICLARVSLGYDDVLKIRGIENVPFNQDHNKSNTNSAKPLTAKTNVLHLMANEDPRADIKVNPDNNELLFTFGLPRSPEAHRNNQISTGRVTIPLNAGGKANRCYYSDFIDHHLGEGHAGIILAVDEKMIQLSGLPEPEEQLIFGNFSVFAESDCVSKVPPVELGAILYPKEGKMKIGVKLLQNTKLKKIDIRWWVYKNVNEVVEEEKKKEDAIKITIKPERITLKKGQKIQLKALLENTDNQNVTWRILDQEGGKITQKGFYTAPMVRGVFKIEATSVADFSKTATVIVIVKD